MRKIGNEVNTNNARNANNTKQSTLPKFQTLAKFEMKKRCVEVIMRIRKETEKNGRELREVLVKKGCKMGGVSL